MDAFLPRALVLASILSAGPASASLTVYSHDDFRGHRATLTDTAPDFRAFDFNDRASSLVVNGEPWEVCKETVFRSRCVVLPPGSYPNLGSIGLNDRVSSARPLPRHAGHPSHPPASHDAIVFFDDRGFHGRQFGVSSEVHDFRRRGYNDRASSVMVFEGRWEACEHADFSGRCVVLRPGSYPDLAAIGLNDGLSSVRRWSRRGARYPDRDVSAPLPVYDWRRRPADRLVHVPVETVRAVYATPQQHCWVEQPQASSNGAVTGAVVGGIIGAILGHQIGEGGSHRDVATAGGAVAGVLIGSQVGRGAQSPATRCTAGPTPERPDYYDVTYHFEGMRHHVQTTTPPGSHILVNDRGEPRL
ncbi:beta/gamma crystallin-related protein [Caldimonas brevitalea]|uniref:Beta/gamma crystallin 'Greek key' domain-containing protein n=1 Tax=Caldimonas brevitalea TaxID=413882 RepID=A0A0G3BRW8_9BURK|nr:beta/gamma crystallin-related protein [Caldimonas brevitalea]AKJ30136.1 hypothetical protein AAW51_3445 [Caldimonas brevitalea]